MAMGYLAMSPVGNSHQPLGRRHARVLQANQIKQDGVAVRQIFALRLAPPHRGKADTRGDEGHRMMQQHAGQ